MSKKWLQAVYRINKQDIVLFDNETKELATIPIEYLEQFINKLIQLQEITKTYKNDYYHYCHCARCKNYIDELEEGYYTSDWKRVCINCYLETEGIDPRLGWIEYKEIKRHRDQIQNALDY